MCVNYLPTPRAVLIQHFKVPDPLGDWPDEVWQDYLAPIIIQGDDGQPKALVASYGMIPKRKIKPGGKHYATMNARAETVGEKISYRNAWAKGYRCLVPMMGFFEPCYETGKAERMRIERVDGAPFAVAGLWRPWKEDDGGYSFSFTQLTINADDHPLMKRMHKPGDEKRSLVLLAQSDFAEWLAPTPVEQARTMLGPFDAVALHGVLAPRPNTLKRPIVSHDQSLG
ncbi:SOS response-associated peptidase [Jeongeupia chitinilytica]|uniref:Abasic site processing protein n=1 Tax=Jeongeupia chitinilytica TaxID=1041641 RepID=A0ABQ3GXE9_9NEIS|nr:SOS response-associated peptidase family protein [Jeongeupia chitinilytica]GHD59906.1 hypothetical protein GCM10007350_11950 [Jeongeupia chitinilytica]